RPGRGERLLSPVARNSARLSRFIAQGGTPSHPRIVSDLRDEVEVRRQRVVERHLEEAGRPRVGCCLPWDFLSRPITGWLNGPEPRKVFAWQPLGPPAIMASAGSFLALLCRGALHEPHGGPHERDPRSGRPSRRAWHASRAGTHAGTHPSDRPRPAVHRD